MSPKICSSLIFGYRVHLYTIAPRNDGGRVRGFGIMNMRILIGHTKQSDVSLPAQREQIAIAVPCLCLLLGSVLFCSVLFVHCILCPALLHPRERRERAEFAATFFPLVLLRPSTTTFSLSFSPLPPRFLTSLSRSFCSRRQTPSHLTKRLRSNTDHHRHQQQWVPAARVKVIPDDQTKPPAQFDRCMLTPRHTINVQYPSP